MEIEYQRMKKLYESKFFPKLFGWKYEKSIYGCKVDMGMGNWGFDHIQYKRECRLNDLNKIEYYDKHDVQMMPIDEGDESEFFLFTKENELPY